MNKRIIDQIEEQRVHQGLTRKELCESAQITVQYYRTLLDRSLGRGVSLVIVERLAYRLGFSITLSIRPD